MRPQGPVLGVKACRDPAIPYRVCARGRDIPDDQYLSGREIGVLSWAGTRGVISLAAIFTLPLTIDAISGLG